MFSALKRLAGKENNNNGAPPGHQTMSHNLQRKFAKGVQYNSMCYLWFLFTKFDFLLQHFKFLNSMAAVYKRKSGFLLYLILKSVFSIAINIKWNC